MIDANSTNKPKIIISLSLILIISFFCFLPSLKNGLTNWDDDRYIIEDTVMQNLSWQNVKTIFTSSQLNNYHPLSRLSYALEYHFFKQEPFIYHLNNLILHLFNCMLVFWFILLLSENIFVSFVTAILFGIHPLHVESVVWVSERRDVLYSLFFLGALISYLYYIKTKIKKCYYFSIGLFVLSLLSKAMAVTLPFILILIDYLFNNKAGRASLKNKAPFFIITILFGIVTFIIRIQVGDFLSKDAFNFYHNITVVCFSLLFYLNKMLMPIKLACIYPYHYSDMNFFHRIFFFNFSTLIILLAGIVILSKYSKKIIFGTIFFIITIFPVIQLIPSSVAISVVFDRYFYIPSIGLFYTFAFVLYRIYREKHKYERVTKPLIQIILIGIISALSILTYNRCRAWKDGISLWNDALKKYPNVTTAYNNRGLLWHERKEYAKACYDFKRAIYYKPKFIAAYLNLGNLYRDMGKKEEAISVFEKILKIEPENAEAYFNIGNICDMLGRSDEAIAFYERAIKNKKNHLLGHYFLGVLYEKLNKKEEAIKILNRAIEIDPNYLQSYIALSHLYESLGRKEEKLTLYKKAIANNLDYLDAYYNIGNLYSDVGRDRDTIPLYKRAIKINPNSAEVYSNLGRSYCAIGKNKEAIISLKKALALNPNLAVVYNNLAVAYYYNKDYDLAIMHCDKATKRGYKVEPKLLEWLKPYQ